MRVARTWGNSLRHRITILPLFFVLCSVPVLVSARAEDGTPQVMSAEEFRRIDPQKRRGDMASVEATLCFQDPFWKFMFLTDQGNGFFVAPSPGTYEIGDRLRIVGPIGNGHGVPILDKSSVVTKVASGSLPVAPLVDLEDWDWSRGFLDRRSTGWIRVRGSIEQITLIDDTTRAWCRHNGVVFPVSLSVSHTVEEAWKLIGTEIEACGALGILLDEQNRVHAPHLLTQRRSMWKMIAPPPPASFPQEPNRKVQFAGADTSGNFDMSGQVTLATDNTLFIHDGFSAAAIKATSTFETPADKFVRILGTRDSDGEWHARVIVLKNETLAIWPDRLSIGDLDATRIGRRIKLMGSVVEYDATNGRLLITCNGSHASIILPVLVGTGTESSVEQLQQENKRSLDLQSAKLIDVLGVVQGFDEGRPIIGVVSGDDIAVLSRKWTLTPSDLTRAIFVLATVLAVVFFVFWWLRHQVRVRTRDLSDLAAQLRASYDSIEAGVVATGVDGQLLTVNETAISLVGVRLKPGDSADEFIKQWKEVAEDPSPVYAMASAFRSDQQEPSVCKVNLKTKEHGKVRLTLAPINRDGQHIGDLWIMHDETQLRKLQSDLLHAQKMEAIGTLAGGVAHDFNNLLTGIICHLELMKFEDSLEGDANRQRVDDILTASLSAAEIVQKLLGLGRRSKTKRKVVSPDSILENLKPLLRHGFSADISFRFNVEPDLPAIRVDPTQIEQVLLNLCVNARDAISETGEIRFRLAKTELRGRDAVVFEVADNGVGIPDEIREKIYDPFFTTKDVGKGSGLGLASSFSILAQHAGELRCDSTVGEGSRFNVVLPAVSRSEIESHNESPLLPQIDVFKGSETILVVDDEWIVRNVAANVLKQSGYSVLEASDGPSGLALLQRANDTVDLVLLDVTMPHMSGHEVGRVVRKRYPSLPVILCSGYDLTGHQTQLSGFGYIPKPFRPLQLLERVRQTLDERSSPTGLDETKTYMSS